MVSKKDHITIVTCIRWEQCDSKQNKKLETLILKGSSVSAVWDKHH